MRSNRAGFTLIEIMIVVGIMGLIALIGIPSIYQIAKKEGMRRAVTDMKDVMWDPLESTCRHASLSIL